MSEVLNRADMDSIRLICDAIDKAGLDYATLSGLQIMIESRRQRAKIDFEGRNKVTLTNLLNRMITKQRINGGDIDSTRAAIRKLNSFLDRPATLNDLTEATLELFYIGKHRAPKQATIKESIQRLARYAVKARLVDERQLGDLLDAQPV